MLRFKAVLSRIKSHRVERGELVKVPMCEMQSFLDPRDAKELTVTPKRTIKFKDATYYGEGVNRSNAEYMMAIYWSHWGNHYQHKTGKPVTYEVLARIHNGGPLGWKKPATLSYWAKVRAAMEGGAK